MMTPLGLAWLKRCEGCTLSAIPDVDSPLGVACRAAKIELINFRALPGWAQLDGKPWTLGYGCTGADIGPNTVWLQPHAEAELVARVAAIETQLASDEPWWPKVDPVRRDVLVNIAYNVGVPGLEHWPVTLGHFAAGDYVAAAKDLEHEGKWNRQTGDRPKLLSKVTANGFWPVIPTAPVSTPAKETTTMTDTSGAASVTANPTAGAAKPVLQSTTIQGAILGQVATLAPVLALVLHTTAASINNDALMICAAVGQVTSLVSFAMVIIGRLKAKQPLF